MAKITKGSKNSIANRGAKIVYSYNGVDILPVKYYGAFIGSGSFMAMKDIKLGTIILDKNGNVLPWSGNAKKKIA